MVVPNGVAVANALHEAARSGKVRRDFGGTGPMSAGEVRKAGESIGLGYWTLYGSLYGLPDNVRIAWSMVQDAFASIKGSRVLAAPAAGMEGLWARSEERRVGKECVSTGRSRWSAVH